ncbi:hypothetical protein AEAC466_19855 [Asticcacaulis sp. AC466]|uniref:hypothetical protein n=1 Tax=Asticcacaulis sp. AC466 TaxID=1282362 RepID=UPI0003C3F51F|nr:hypothetical protein [Asticcacaulis sp. AC466]ESQ81820.1 hypothetical protein AEAC466_19855 [Asticcacaulis sp. AC466]
MLVFAVALAVAATCPVEKAHYSLRHQRDVTLSVVQVERSQDWPSGIALALHNRLPGHTTYFLPWNGGNDGRQNVAHTTDVTRPDFHLPSPDGGPGRLGDMEYIGADANYDLINHAPQKGDAAPAHILMSGLADSSWQGDAIDKQFFDLDGCSG